jgi:hypothetical protein
MQSLYGDMVDGSCYLLVSILDPAIENSLRGEQRFHFHQVFLDILHGHIRFSSPSHIHGRNCRYYEKGSSMFFLSLCW